MSLITYKFSDSKFKDGKINKREILSFADELKKAGIVLYELHLTDKKGNELSDYEKFSVLKAFYNTDKDKNGMIVEGKEMKTISILDNTGRLMYSRNLLNSSREILSVNQFSKGVYLLKVIHENGQTKTEKLVIE